MKIIIFALLLLVTFSSFAQKAAITYYDANGAITKKAKNAATFKVVIKENDSTYIVRYYQNLGSMIKQETYKDESQTIKNGYFYWYNEGGDVDSFYQYKNDELAYNSNKKISTYLIGKKDSTNNINSKDTISIQNAEYTVLGKSAEFSGGQGAWVKFLQQNLNVRIGESIPKYKNLTNNKAIVTVSFLIYKNGAVQEINILHSCGYPFDTEAVRVIKASPNWYPATIKNGEPVTYRQRQRIIFNK